MSEIIFKENKKDAMDCLKKVGKDGEFMVITCAYGDNVQVNKSCDDMFIAIFIHNEMKKRPELTPLLEYLEIKDDQSKPKFSLNDMLLKQAREGLESNE